MDGDRLALELLRESKISLIFFLKSLHKNVDIYIFMCYNISTLKKGDK